MFIFKILLKAVLLPPGFFIALIFLAMVVTRRSKHAAVAILSFTAVMMLILSMTALSGTLLQTLIHHDPLDLSAGIGESKAIVVLTGGVKANSPEYGRDVSSTSSLTRARYAAFLHKNTGLPIMVVGGKPRPSTLSEGEAMKQLLEDEFHVPVRWVEIQAKDTEDSSVNSFEMLRRDGVVSILLVSNVFHMRRAELNFARAGFKVVPAPIGFRSKTDISAYSFLPTVSALSETTRVLNEWYGIAWGYVKAMTR
jgi:uncharacterized SAM-binding protein YcdF (DUF218 family)